MEKRINLGNQHAKKDRTRSAWVPGIRTYPEILEKLDKELASIKKSDPSYTRSRLIERKLSK